jgi:hypothetical protein
MWGSGRLTRRNNWSLDHHCKATYFNATTKTSFLFFDTRGTASVTQPRIRCVVRTDHRVPQ